MRTAPSSPFGLRQCVVGVVVLSVDHLVLHADDDAHEDVVAGLGLDRDVKLLDAETDVGHDGIADAA